MARRANPAFAAAVVLVPLLALATATTAGSREVHTYVHVMAGVLWTGIDLFMALVLGPVLGGLAVDERASVFERFTPKMAFLMPTLALVTIAAGITLLMRVWTFPAAQPWLAAFTFATTVPALLLIAWQFDAFRDPRWLLPFGVALLGSVTWFVLTMDRFAMTSHLVAVALGIVTVLSVLGFGVLMPGEVRMFVEMTSENPDRELIGAIGMRNAKLAGIQGGFQLAIILVMVYMRWGYV
jgi:hypothetical protein